MKESEKVLLESLIDAYGVDGVAQAMYDICHEKADHVRSNWQDEQLAKQWGMMADKVIGFHGQILKVQR